MKKEAILLIFALLGACSNKSSPDSEVLVDTTSFEYKPLKLKRIYTELRGQNGMSGYEHFVTAENYKAEGDNFLVSYADKYIDTCNSQLPIVGITFCKPFEFTPNYDSQDLEPLFSHALVSIGYPLDSVQRKFPEIESVTFYKDSKRIYIQLNTLERRNRKRY
jgi:hypothetical protein